MKKFCFRLFLFIVPVICFIVLFEYLLRKTPNDYSYKYSYLEEHGKDIQTLILGNSHTFFGVNPEMMKGKVFNLANVSQPLSYDNVVLSKFGPSMSQLKCIVIPIDYFSFFDRLENGPEKWRVKNYNLYYHMHISADPSNYFEVANGKQLFNFIRLYRYLATGKENVTCNAQGWGTAYKSSESKNLEITGKEAATRHTAKDSLAIPDNIAAVNNIIRFAKARNIKVVFITSPAYKTYVERLSRPQMDRTMSLIKTVTEQHPEVKYYNLMNDASFTATDFFDADHVNDEGAAKLSVKIDSLIHL